LITEASGDGCVMGMLLKRGDRILNSSRGART
jgi:hypothetical protein